MCADIEIPLLEVAIGARVNRGTHERLHIPRQYNLLRGRGALRSSDRHRRLRHLCGFSTYGFLVQETCHNAVYEEPSENHEKCARDQPASFPPARCFSNTRGFRSVRKSCDLCLRLHWHNHSYLQMMFLLLFPANRSLAQTVDDAENRGYEEQCRSCCKEQSADHCTSQRCILFTPIAQSQRHGYHADD